MSNVPAHLQSIVDKLLSDSDSDVSAPAAAERRPETANEPHASSHKRKRLHKEDDHDKSAKGGKQAKKRKKHKHEGRSKQHHDFEQHDYEKGLQMQIDFAKTGRQPVLQSQAAAQQAKRADPGMPY